MDGSGPNRLWRHRLRVRLGRARLDRDLAAGRAPAGSRPHALRARQLADPRRRREVAAELRQVVADAEAPRDVLRPARIGRSSVLLGLRGGVVRSCREPLLGLAERLEDGRAVDPVGVARARVLLTDAAGPLFHTYAPRSLRESVWWIADALEPATAPAPEPAVRGVSPAATG